MNIKKKNLVLIIIATFVFATLLSCGVFALVAKSVSFNMVMHLNPTVYFGLELQVDSNGDGDFNDSFTSNNVAFNESTVYTIFDNRITNFVDHEPWAIVNLNKIVLQNTDELNNPFGDLGVNTCFKIKVLNYTSPEMLEVDANSAEMQALWLTLVPEDMPSMYAVPEYGVQNVAYGSFKEFMIYPQSITTDYFEIPFTVELKNKTVDHLIINSNSDIVLNTLQTHITNGEIFKAEVTSPTGCDAIKIDSVTVGETELGFSYKNNILTISGGSNLDPTQNVIINSTAGYFLIASHTQSNSFNVKIKALAGGEVSSYQNVDESISQIIFGKTLDYSTMISGLTGIALCKDASKSVIKAYFLNKVIYVLSDKMIFTTERFAYAFANMKNLTTVNFDNLNTYYASTIGGLFEGCSSITISQTDMLDLSNVETAYYMYASTSITSFTFLSQWAQNDKLLNISGFFSWCVNLSNVNFQNLNTTNVFEMRYFFRGCMSLESVDLSYFNTQNVKMMNQMFYYCTLLETIYVSNYFVTTQVTDSVDMFLNCSVNLVGGNGTTWASTNLCDKTYAIVDGTEGKKGYFTYKSPY